VRIFVISTGIHDSASNISTSIIFGTGKSTQEIPEKVSFFADFILHPHWRENVVSGNLDIFEDSRGGFCRRINLFLNGTVALKKIWKDFGWRAVFLVGNYLEDPTASGGAHSSLISVQSL